MATDIYENPSLKWRLRHPNSTISGSKILPIWAGANDPQLTRKGWTVSWRWGVRPDLSPVKWFLLNCFQSISSVDKSDCGKLYLCEISATPPSKLLREDQKTLELLRRTYSQVGILWAAASLIIKLFTKFLPWNRDWRRRGESNLTWLGKSGLSLGVLMCAGNNSENVQLEELLVL